MEISVVVTTRNRCDLLRRAISSVEAQTYPEFEIVVVDDSSSDETPDWLQARNGRPITVIRSDENIGLSEARNRGWRAAKGRYICFLDDDDVWDERKLTEQHAKFKELSNEYGLVYCWSLYEFSNGNTSIRAPTYRGSILDECLRRQPITNGSTWMIRREALECSGGFVRSIRRGVDGAFLRKLSRTYLVDYVDQLLVKYDASVTRPRITNESKESLNQSIYEITWRLTEFKDEFSKSTSAKAEVLCSRAVQFVQVSNYRSALTDLTDAFRIEGPTKIFWKTLARILYHRLRSFVRSM